MKDNSIGFVNAKHGDFMFYNYDEFVGLSIREYGEWSEKLLDQILSFLNKSDYVFDIGSHVGLFTVPISKKIGPEGKLFSFEPQKMLYYLQCANLALNDIKNVEVFNVGMGKSKKEVLVDEINYSKPGNFGGFGLGKDYDYSKFINVNDGKKTKINVKNLDLFQNIKRCDLIKLEAELLEKQILEGGLKFLKKFRPIIICENCPSNPQELNSFLFSQDYDLYWFDYTFFNEENYFINSENHFDRVGKFYIFAFPKEKNFSFKNYVKITKPNQKNPNLIGKNN
ncbi:MAG: hypothetical protein CMM95_00275 [Rickettsiales bacterium]|nr:hypothetical protein [Rickettsiales bacterium]